jgi:hypothetical protein
MRVERAATAGCYSQAFRIALGIPYADCNLHDVLNQPSRDGPQPQHHLPETSPISHGWLSHSPEMLDINVPLNANASTVAFSASNGQLTRAACS